MKKSVIKSALLCSLLITLAALAVGCGSRSESAAASSGGAPSAVQSSQAGGDSTGSPAITDSQSSSSVYDPGRVKSYFGDWVVSRQIPLPREIGSLTAAEAKSLIGKKMRIQADSFTSLDNKTLKHPQFYENTLDDMSFFTEWKFHLLEVGINEQTVEEVYVYKSNPTDGFAFETLGGAFGVIDADTLYINVKGQFFELVRA